VGEVIQYSKTSLGRISDDPVIEIDTPHDFSRGIPGSSSGLAILPKQRVEAQTPQALRKESLPHFRVPLGMCAPDVPTPV